MCAIGVYTHNLEPSLLQQIDLKDALGVFSDLGYVRAEDLPSIPVVNAAQTLILSEAAQQVENHNARQWAARPVPSCLK